MLVIHIGFAKTGTTSLQDLLALNAERLAASGLYYPSAARQGGAHHRLAERQPDGRFHLGDWTAVLALARSQPAVVVSSERLSGLSEAALWALRDAMDGVPVRVVASLRRYPEWQVSRYTQTSKSGRNGLDFDAYFEAELDAFADRVIGELQGWSKTWGAGNLVVSDRTGEALAIEIAGLAGVDIGHLEPLATRSNVDPGWRAVEVLRAIFTRAASGPIAPTSPAIEAPLNTRFRDAVIRALADEGLTEARGAYLTEDQIAEGDARMARIEAALEGWTRAPVGVGRTPSSVARREFRPGIEVIPVHCRARILPVLRRVLADGRDIYPEALSEAVEAVFLSPDPAGVEA